MKNKRNLLLLIPLLFLSFSENNMKKSQAATSDQQEVDYVLFKDYRGNHIMFVNKNAGKSASTNTLSLLLNQDPPEYVLDPQEHIYDGIAEDGCDYNPADDNDQFYYRIHTVQSQLGFTLTFRGAVTLSIFDDERTYFYNTNDAFMERSKQHLDCWCDNDPVETVKKLN